MTSIRIHQGHDPPPDTADVHVVIDVLRAFTCTHAAFLRGAERILLVGEVDEARELRRAHPDWLLAGEVGALPIPGFDFGNSPVEIDAADLSGRTLILRTSNGVQAALSALGAETVLAAGFTSARTTARYVKRILSTKADPTVTLMASHPSSDDDVACAEFIRELLLGEDPDRAPFVERIRASRSAARFFDAARTEFDPRDVDWATREIPSDFAMAVEASPRPTLVKVGLPG